MPAARNEFKKKNGKRRKINVEAPRGITARPILRHLASVTLYNIYSIFFTSQQATGNAAAAWKLGKTGPRFRSASENDSFMLLLLR
jgi:hypothetical protein